jgi:hypothetical protein
MSLSVLSVGTSRVDLRRATAADLPALVEMLAEDPLGRDREAPSAGEADLAPYLRAFALVDGDPAQLLVVAAEGGDVVGTLQLSLIPGLSRRGSLRAQIEAVRVRAGHRNRALG